MQFNNLRLGFLMILAFAASKTSAVQTNPDAVLIAVGDIAVCEAVHRAEWTAHLVERLLNRNDAVVVTLGDNSQNDGRFEEYLKCFEPAWGRFKQKLRPSPGNHDDYDERPGLGHGGKAYYEYFGDRAGPPGLGYYSFDLGYWHIVSLNSEIVVNRPTPEQAQRMQSQMNWLRRDLSTHDNHQCTLAYFHRPMVSSGQFAAGRMKRLWEVLYAGGVDVILNGHEHFYERFAPQDHRGNLDHRFGIRQFIVGTGGAYFHGFGRPTPNSVMAIQETLGVIQFVLRPSHYLWEFIDIHGVVRDAGVGECHGKPEIF